MARSAGTRRRNDESHDGRLTGEHAAQDQDHAGGLGRPERLAGQGHAQQRADDRVDQADQRGGAGAEAAYAGEPRDVGEAGADQRQVGEGDQAPRVDGRGCPLDQQRDRQQEQPARDQLPGGEGEQVGRGLPALDQHEAERRDGHGAEGGGDADDVHRPAAAQHQQRDADQADDAAGEAEPGRPLRRPRGHASAMTTSGDIAVIVAASPPGQVVGRQEDQREERADVEHARGAPSATTTRRAGSSRRQASISRPDRERADQTVEERPVGGGRSG